MPSLLNVFAPQEEDATIWARYSSAQFDQGAGRHACNNPYNALLEPTILENALKGGKVNSIAYKDFLDLVAPSFGGVEDTEDMAAIFARTHLIVLTDKGVYWRLAGTDKEDVQFIPWPDNQSKDLLVDSQKPIFQAYKKDPEAHALPANFHEDSVWSQELLRKLLSGEEIPRTVTVRGVSLFGNGSFETHTPFSKVVARIGDARQSEARAGEPCLPKLEATSPRRSYRVGFTFSCEEASFSMQCSRCPKES